MHPQTHFKHYLCNDKKKRQEWQDWQEEVKREEDPIERYCNKIRGITPDYAISYEESVKIQEENWNYRKTLGDKELENRNNPMEGMTKAEKEQERKQRRLAREERKESELNHKLTFSGTPNYLIEKRIRKIPCECEAEKMRQGIFCPTCRLLVRVNDYMLDLFKTESEGRGTII